MGDCLWFVISQWERPEEERERVKERDEHKLICTEQTISRMTNYFAFGFYFHPHEARKS